MAADEQECCPRLDVSEWDRREFEWEGKPFYKTRYRSFLRIPLTIGKAVTKAMQVIEGRDLQEYPELMLSREESAFGSTMLLSLKEGAPDLPVERLSGRYVSMLFQGPYRDAGKWVAQTKQYVESKGVEAEDLLFWYVTCPKCAKKFGSAQTVVFARVA